MTRVHCPCGAWNDADIVASCPCGRAVRGLSGFVGRTPRETGEAMHRMEDEARRLALPALETVTKVAA